MEDLSKRDAEYVSAQIVNTFEKLKKAIEEGRLDLFKNHLKLLHTVGDKVLIQQFIDGNDIDLFCLISQYSHGDMLEYLLDQTQILYYLSPVENAKRNHNIQTTFYNCMINGNTALLENFYDHWAGDLHWAFNKTSTINDNENLYNLCILLNEAKTQFLNYIENISYNPQNFAEIHCILTFNEFQIQLYEKLNEVKAKISNWKEVSKEDNTVREIEALKEILGIIFDVHEKYSKDEIVKALEMPRTDETDISEYTEATIFYVYKTCFWKTDYNLCILVLDNLFLLKRRLRMQPNVYQNLESMLYRFIYHFKTKWSFYLSQTEICETDIISRQENGVIYIYETSYPLDLGGMKRYFIMYLERKYFLEGLRSFKSELEKPISAENIRKPDEKFTDEEIQSLLQFPELRDDFSLKKMWRYLQELPSKFDIKHKKEWSYLLLERILQVVGEFLKSTKDTMNLEPTTQALIMAEVPIDVVKSLHQMRNILCKQNDIRILWRMEIAKHGEDILKKLRQDLLHLRDAIRKVISINRYFVNRSLAKFGFKILHHRNDYIIENIGIPEYLYRCYSQFLGGIHEYPHFGKILLDDFYRTTYQKHGLSKNLMMEVGQIHYDFNMLDKKTVHELKRIQKFLKQNFLHYKKTIEHLLEQVIFQLTNWNSIKSYLENTDDDMCVSDYPNYVDLNKVQTHFHDSEDEHLELYKSLRRYTDVDVLWDLIERLFEFLIIKTKCFDHVNAELKFGMFSFYYKELSIKKYKTDEVKGTVETLLNLIEDHCSPKAKNTYLYKNRKFDGIQEYADVLNIKQFVTKDEVQYIVTNIPDGYKNKEDIINDIGNNYFIDMDRNVKIISAIEPFDETSEKIIRNVMASDRNPELLLCYVRRICLLSNIVDQQPKDLLISRYKYDAQFRILLEMILIDLLNILQKCKIKESLQKQNKLLTEINIRNVLAHGNPLLEVIGDVLDANDLPGEIIDKSLKIIGDIEPIQALVQLQNNGFPFQQLYSNDVCENLNDDDTKLLRTFQKLDKWRSYLHLIPEYKEFETDMTKMFIDNKRREQMELIDAAKRKDKIENIEEVLKRVDIDKFDEYGNAAIHYAAMNGKVAILEDLIKHKADIDIKSEVNGMTALHYGALKGHRPVVELLKLHGAKVEADKDGHTYKDIEDRQTEAAKRRLEEKEAEIDFLADDFKLFDLDD